MVIYRNLSRGLDLSQVIFHYDYNSDMLTIGRQYHEGLKPIKKNVS